MNMNRHCGIIKFILLGVVCISLLPVSVHAQKYTEFIPGEVWKDTDGNPINAHGGGLLYHNGTYYWYGEYKKGKTILPDWATWECYRTDVTGVGCYSSKDLLNWKFEGIVLPAEHPFWTSPAEDWTSKKAWEGKDFPKDHAVH